MCVWWDIYIYIRDDNVKGSVVVGFLSDGMVFGKRVVVRGREEDRHIRLDMTRECGVVSMSVMVVAFFP